MKKLTKQLICFGLSLVLGLTAVPAIALADNPISQTQYTADPSPFIVRGDNDDPSDDVMYVLTSHDEDIIEDNFYTMKDHKVFSTTDMVNWTDHGVMFGQDWYEWGTKTGGYRSWASQIIERDGKFYLYIPCLRKGGGNGQSGWQETGGSPGYGIGVCVSDNPYGPYVDALISDENPHGRPLIYGGWNDIDPTVYIDDDGQAYLFYSQSLKYYHLNDDMISTVEPNGPNDQGRSFSVPDYTEGPWLGKHDGYYYFLWAGHGNNTSAHQGGETLLYAYCKEGSQKALGSYTFGGLLQETTRGGSFTNHPGMSEEFKGHYYLFYHTDVLPNGGSYHRSVCCDELFYNDDGTIDKVPMTESAEAVDTLDPYKQVEAETIAWEKGIKTECYDTADWGYNHVYVYNTHNDDFILVRNVDFGDEGAIKFTAALRKCKPDAGASIEVYIDGKKNINYGNGYRVSNSNYDLSEATQIATLDCDVEGDDWEERTVDLDEKVTGVHDVVFVFKGSYNAPNNETTVSATDTGMFQYDYWKMEGEPKPDPTPGPEQQGGNTDPSGNNNGQQAGVNPTGVQPSTNQPTAETPAAKTITKVKGIKIKKSGTKATVTWKKADGASKYEVWCALKKNFKGSVKKVKVKTTYAKFKKLKKGKTYWFKVRGINGSNKGSFSAAKKAKI